MIEVHEVNKCYENQKFKQWFIDELEKRRQENEALH